MNIQESAMELIAGAGESKSYAMEAIGEAKLGNFDKAYECIDKAKEEMVATHGKQLELIRDEMTRDKRSEVSLLMVHAQDHLTSAMIMRDMAVEFIELYKIILEKE